ncbi:gluconate 2-dehydrogenase subunit 3 family protein [Paraglaciecola aquimarina]|uniref:Gluconate 2-dehydrogenase subunit 3 family protein n=1 Tax=Paraglaciecola algarum TaxID=3050085 RepID=A0ABS9D5E4_9ALTE|nr:gluconate 2-dehydrogenase subunit 3 family protein [Paraglaciecola sp. G1-23]MCF2947899.1 gluconate 2-dehydrogenase subunit 3 family protein [Paraglaciecola sp. G1-23]
MNRRELLIQAMAVMGAAVSAPVLSAVNAYASASNKQAHLFTGPSIFSPKQRKMIELLTEMIIPQTDTPGAIEAGVPDFIDTLVSNWYADYDKKYLFHGMRLLDNHCLVSFGKDFIACSEEQQIVALEDAEQNVLGAISDGEKGGHSQRVAITPQDWAPWGDRHRAGNGFFSQIKNLTVLAYYTSEIGATQALIYDPVPGEYIGDADFATYGKHFTN